MTGCPRFLFILLLPLWQAAAQAGPVVLTCPATLAVTSNAPAPAGWETVASDQPHGLEGIAMFSGHPRELASLVPDKQTRKGKQLESVWNLPGGSGGYWLGCSYARTTLQAAQRLPAGLTRCTATHTGPSNLLQPNPEVRCE